MTRMVWFVTLSKMYSRMWMTCTIRTLICRWNGAFSFPPTYTEHPSICWFNLILTKRRSDKYRNLLMTDKTIWREIIQSGNSIADRSRIHGEKSGGFVCFVQCFWHLMKRLNLGVSTFRFSIDVVISDLISLQESQTKSLLQCHY